MSEIERQSAIMDYLQTKRYFFWRQNTTGIYDQAKKTYRKNPRQTLGVPDIFVLKYGVLYGLEVKSATGEQTKEQIEFGRRMVAAGGYYAVVRNINDVMALGL